MRLVKNSLSLVFLVSSVGMALAVPPHWERERLETLLFSSQEFTWEEFSSFGTVCAPPVEGEGFFWRKCYFLPVSFVYADEEFFGYGFYAFSSDVNSFFEGRPPEWVVLERNYFLRAKSFEREVSFRLFRFREDERKFVLVEEKMFRQSGEWAPALLTEKGGKIMFRVTIREEPEWGIEVVLET